MTTILVTGGAGYIGAHACKLLAREGFTPVTYDDLSTGHAEAVRFGPLERGGLRDRTRLEAAFARHRPAAVMHFAARSDVGEARRDPGRYWRDNLEGSLTLVETALAAKCRHVVFSSTCAVYGDRGAATLDEESVRAPLNAYGASKRAVEDMLRDFGGSDGLHATIFRYFNVAGADPEGELGEVHDPETHLVPLVLEAVEGRHPALTIHGTDYETADGTCIRDYTHVSDLAEAHVLGLKRLLAGGGSRVFNLGTGRGYSVREVIDTAARVLDRPVPVNEGPRRSGDAVRLVSGGERAKRELGWSLRRSDLPTMIADAWRWHRSRGFGQG